MCVCIYAEMRRESACTERKGVCVQGRCLRGHVDLMVNQLLNKVLQLNMW